METLAVETPAPTLAAADQEEVFGYKQASLQAMARLPPMAVGAVIVVGVAAAAADQEE